MFPFIDLIRIIVLDQNAVNYILREHSSDLENQLQNKYFQILYKHINENHAINSMLVIRIFCNLFKSLNKLEMNKQIISSLINERNFLFNWILKLSETNNKTLQISCSTLVLNFSVLNPKLVDLNFTVNFCSELFLEQIQFINNDILSNRLINWDHEAIFRIMVSYGNLVNNIPKELDKDYILSVAKSLNNFIVFCRKICFKPENYTKKVSQCSKYLLTLFN